MKRMMILIGLSGMLMASSGCIFTSNKPSRSSSSASASKKCGPAYHWDGHKCKHNGKGHGARKHDR